MHGIIFEYIFDQLIKYKIDGHAKQFGMCNWIQNET